MLVADMNEASVYSEIRKKHAKKRKRQSNSEGPEQNKPRKKRPKVEVINTSADPMVSYSDIQMSSVPNSNTGISQAIKKVRIKQVKKVKLQSEDDKLQTEVKPSEDQKFLDETRRCSGKYYIHYPYCMFIVYGEILNNLFGSAF